MILRKGSIRNGDLDFTSIDENDLKFDAKLQQKLSEGWQEESPEVFFGRIFSLVKTNFVGTQSADFR